MSRGIFNPFKPRNAAPKKDFLGATDPRTPLNTEYEEFPKSSIRLDGDSYILQFNKVEMPELHQRLETLLKDIVKNPANREQLANNGVSFIEKPNTPVLTDGQLQLETPTGYVVVYGGASAKEVDCFRRLAYALYVLPIKDILEKNNATVYRRG